MHTKLSAFQAKVSSMFTLALRGQFGVSIAVQIHIAIALSGIAIFTISNSYAQFLFVSAFILRAVSLIRKMNEGKDQLRYNSAKNRLLAYPDSQRIASIMSIFNSVPVAIFFIPVVGLLFANVSLPEVPMWASFICYYLGSLCLVDIIQGIIRTRI